MEQMKNSKDIDMTDLDEIKHLEAKKCFLCNGAFNNKVEAKRKSLTTATSQDYTEERHI